MALHKEAEIGIDLLTEASFGYFLTDSLVDYSYYVAFMDDTTTPINVISGFSWMDELRVPVRRADYSSYVTEIPLPIIAYDLQTEAANAIQLGSEDVSKIYVLYLMLHAENKPQLVNLTDFVSTLLRKSRIPVLNYNSVDNTQIGVIYCRDIRSTRMFGVFDEPNIADRYVMSISCEAVVEYNNDFSLS